MRSFPICTDRRPRSRSQRRRLSALAALPENYAAGQLSARFGYEQDERHVDLGAEAPGEPVRHGLWESACERVADYAFADPATVRAFYGPRPPEPGRDMLLRLTSMRIASVYAGVRVQRVVDEERQVAGRPVRIWGWTYGTLAGHIEEGEMSWQVWKWLDDGTVHFVVRWISKPAPIANPVIRLGFRLVGTRERRHFLAGTGRRMRQLTHSGEA